MHNQSVLFPGSGAFCAPSFSALLVGEHPFYCPLVCGAVGFSLEIRLQVRPLFPEGLHFNILLYSEVEFL